MKALGIVGWSGAGKTTLIEQLIPVLRAGGLRVSTIKHAHHGFDLDRPGKDSHRHRIAGAEEVLVASGTRWALLHEGTEPPVATLLALMSPVDLVLVEGYKTPPIAKLEVHRPALHKPPLWPEVSGVLAVASDTALPTCPHRVLRLDDPAAICDWITTMLPLLPDAALNA
jgi:molybdopterin-guanine dinucleotide biosynthesis protein B